MTPKRAAILAGFYPLFAGATIAARIGWLADELFYPHNRDEPIQRPVFIIGNPRSGTTFLYRLLAKDQETFTAMRLWEMLFAPSIAQRRIVHGLAALDRRLGNPVRRLIARADQKAAAHNAVHGAQLLAPEEDQFLLIHAWATLAIWHFSGVLEEAQAYTHFDTLVPAKEKRRIMMCHRRGVQRHLLAHRRWDGSERHYLAKNPSASPKVRALLETFPDARFVYLVRNPLSMIPSMISCLEFTWQVLGDPPEPYAARDYVLDMAEHWYTYPLTQLEQLPQERYAIISFESLTQDAHHVVRALYDKFGFEMFSDYAAILNADAEEARAYKSRHHYDLAEMGLSRDDLVDRFATVFERFGFETHPQST